MVGNGTEARGRRPRPKVPFPTICADYYMYIHMYLCVTWLYDKRLGRLAASPCALESRSVARRHEKAFGSLKSFPRGLGFLGGFEVFHNLQSASKHLGRFLVPQRGRGCGCWCRSLLSGDPNGVSSKEGLAIYVFLLCNCKA